MLEASTLQKESHLACRSSNSYATRAADVVKEIASMKRLFDAKGTDQFKEDAPKDFVAALGRLHQLQAQGPWYDMENQGIIESVPSVSRAPEPSAVDSRLERAPMPVNDYGIALEPNADSRKESSGDPKVNTTSESSADYLRDFHAPILHKHIDEAMENSDTPLPLEKRMKLEQAREHLDETRKDLDRIVSPEHRVKLKLVGKQFNDTKKIITQNKKTIAKHEKTIVKHEKTIAENEGTIAKHEETIAKHRKTLAEYKARMDEKRQAILELLQQTNEIKKHMTEVEEAINQAMANKNEKSEGI
ncbi:hypothetical protein F4778DRAFT_395189 [Xylariomycetidae sp. FL2044]|nr:hypothetical protein F4778DRAFT_395189 [Xylariomycetidae sp. FL2044]